MRDLVENSILIDEMLGLLNMGGTDQFEDNCWFSGNVAINFRVGTSTHQFKAAGIQTHFYIIQVCNLINCYFPSFCFVITLSSLCNHFYKSINCPPLRTKFHHHNIFINQFAMVLFRNNANFARLSKCRSLPYLLLANEIIKEIKVSDLPTLVLSIDHIVSFLRRVPKNTRDAEQKAEQKLVFANFFKALSQKLSPLERYLLFIMPNFHNLVKQQN